MNYPRLSLGRKVLASLLLLAFFLLFTFGVVLPGLEGLAAMQFGPALLAGGFGVLLAIILATFIFGRVYCSILCPLGLTQDLLARLRKKRSYKKLKASWILRLGILALFTASFASGWLFFFEAIDPYSAFGRMMAAIVKPCMDALGNSAAWLAQLFDSNLFAWREIHFSGWTAFGAAILTLAALLGLVLRHGRAWCNFCPVGTALGLLAQKALFRLRLAKDKCVSCGLCQKSCKTGCIDVGQGGIDASRCVVCLDCAALCPKGAIGFATPGAAAAGSGLNVSKRAFLRAMGGGAILSAVAAPALQAADRERINRPDIVPARRSLRPRAEPLVPPGAQGLDNFAGHCIGCQLCVNVCPNNVLVSSTQGAGLLQPGMSFEKGYCRPNCVKCGEVCPTGAIRAISVEDKKRIGIGKAAIDQGLCIVRVDKIQCSACQRICPQEAISLKGDLSGNLKMPFVDVDRCTGCGACEYVCPAQPLAAIAVRALKTHEPVTL